MLEVQGGWQERIAGWLSDPVVKSALVGIIFLAVMTEVKTAGTGVAALIGLVATAMFFGSQWVTGVATWVEVLLFLAGLVLLAIEFFVPGFGLFGIAGIASILFSLFMTLGGGVSALSIMASGTVAAVVAFLLLLKYLPSSGLWKRLVLRNELRTEQGYTASEDLTQLIGQEGVVLTLLRPAGAVRIGEKVLDVVSEGRFIEPGVRVKVLGVQGSRVVVRAIEE